MLEKIEQHRRIVDSCDRSCAKAHVRQLAHNEVLHAARDKTDAATAENGIGGIVAAILHTYDTLRNLSLRCRMMSSILAGEHIGMRISNNLIGIGKGSACTTSQLSVPFTKRTAAARRRQRRQRFWRKKRASFTNQIVADAVWCHHRPYLLNTTSNRSTLCPRVGRSIKQVVRRYRPLNGVEGTGEVWYELSGRRRRRC
jgi:hypothetical protein